MNFAFTEEQHQFRDSVRRFLSDKSTTSAVREVMITDVGFDPAVWRATCDELGLAGLPIPEAYGGVGFGHVELCIALEEMGRQLYCGPFFSSIVLAAGALLHTASETEKQRFLPHIASGEKTATLALAETNGDWQINSVNTFAESQGSNCRLNGTKTYVIDGATADWIFVVAHRDNKDGNLALFFVDGNADGLSRRPLDVIDPTRKQAELIFNNVAAQCISKGDVTQASFQRLLDEAAIALANEMVGGAQYLLDSALEYAKLRMQFGRLIGSFQAIKHQLADLLLEVEHAKSAAYLAANAIDAADEELPKYAATAKATASDTFMRAAATCIQIHGGIGFTWDNDTHLWFKRAKSSEVFLGTPDWHRENYMNFVESRS